MDIPIECQNLQQTIEPILTDFIQHLDVNSLIERLRPQLFLFLERLIKGVIETVFHDRNFLRELKKHAGRCALRFNGFKQTSIRLLWSR